MATPASSRLRRALAVALAAPGLVLGQQGDDGITVTATRIERPSLEIPASINRVYGEDFRFARPLVNLSEALGTVPGLVVQNRQNYAQDLQVSSRGFGTRASFGIRGIRLIADGIPASMPDGQGQAAHFDLGSAGRIEVLRGPFAVMHGNASGGVINVITAQPAPGATGDLSFGSWRTQRAALQAAGESWRVSASRFDTDGYRRHSAARRDLFNAKATLSLSASTGLTLVANALDAPETRDPLGMTRAQMVADPRQAVAQAFTFDTRKTVRQQQAGATLTHRFDGASLTASAWGGAREVRQFLGFAGSTPVTTSGGVVDLDRGFGGASLQLARDGSLFGRKATLVAGLEVERMAERRKGFVNANGALGALRRDEDDTVTSRAAWLQAEWRFAERWIALAGLRANRVAFRVADLFIVPGNPDDSGRRDYGATTPVLGLLYRVSPTTSVYANTGRGFETPTFAELAHQNTGSGLNFALAPSRSRHLEAGVKAAFGSALRVNAALFDIETRDEIVVDASAGGRTTFRNAGRTRRSGAELAIEATLPAGFDTRIAWTRLDARFRDGFSGGTPPVAVAAGNLLPGTPRTYASAMLRWRHAASGFTLSLEAEHKSRVAVNDVNSEFADAYTMASLAGGFTQQGARWKVSEFVRIDNLADRRYAGSVIVNEGNGRFFEPAPGRSVLVGVQARLLLD